MKGTNRLPRDARHAIGASLADEETCHPDAACIHGCTPGGGFTAPRREVGSSLKTILEYRNEEVVLRIADKVDGNIDEARQIFAEYLAYMVRVKAAIKPSSPTKREDIGWHEHILFTQDYAKFCDEYIGFFVHHVPTPRLNRPRGTEGNSATLADCGCGSSCGVCRSGAQPKVKGAPYEGGCDPVLKDLTSATCGSSGGGKAQADANCEPSCNFVPADPGTTSCGHCSTKQH